MIEKTLYSIKVEYTKSKFIVFGSAQSTNFKTAQVIFALLNGTARERIKNFQYLGVIVNKNMSWVLIKWTQYLKRLTKGLVWSEEFLRLHVLLDSRVPLYSNSLIIDPLFEYGDIIGGDKNNETLIWRTCNYCRTKLPRPSWTVHLAVLQVMR